MKAGRLITGALASLVFSGFATSALAQVPGEVEAAQAVGAATGGFGGALQAGDAFGGAVAWLDDLDGDGLPEVAIGAPGSDVGGANRGAVWIAFMEGDGTVKSQVRIAQGQGGFGGTLKNQDAFGQSLAAIGDLDGDGISELAVGTPNDDDGGTNFGAIWILFLGNDGTVRESRKISALSGGFGGVLFNQDELGRGLAALGDLDGDGVPDLAAGALNDDDGSPQQGAVWVLLLNADGTVKSESKISEGESGFGGSLDTGDEFGRALVALGDLGGDGTLELAVGASADDDGGSDRGAVWLLSLQADGNVAAWQKFSATAGGLPFVLDDQDRFGRGLAAPGDLDGDGVQDLVVGAPGDDDGAIDAGAVWELLLEADGTVKGAQKISTGSGGFPGTLADGAAFGRSLAAGVLDGQGGVELLVGAPGAGSGTAWVLFLVGVPEDGGEVFVPNPDAFTGRAGRPALVPVQPSGGDFIDQPVIAVPNTSGSTVSVRSGTASTSTGEVAFFEEGLYESGDEPAMADSGIFFSTADFVPLADIVTANTGGDSFSLLRGNPDGTFGPHVEFSLAPFNSRPTVIRAVDLDGNGLDDVVVGGAQGVSVFLGDGMGGFPSSSFIALPNVTDLVVGLVDGDGLLDVVVSTGKAVTPADPLEEGAATVLLNQGGGALAAGGSFATGAAVASVLLGDLAGGPALDALLAIHDVDGGPGGIPEGRLELWLGDGAGGFLPAAGGAALSVPDADGIHPRFGSLGDLDGDGDLDALYTSTGSVALAATDVDGEQPPLVVTVLGNQGGGILEADVLGTAYAGRAVDPLLADVVPDLDGRLDGILIWWQDTLAGLGGAAGDPDGLTSLISVLASDGAGGFLDPSATLFSTGDEPGDGVLVDTDQSGRIDIVVPNLRDNSLTLLEGNGDGGIGVTVTVRNVDDLDPLSLPPGDWLGGPRSLQMAELDDAPELDAVVYNAWEDRSGASTAVYASFSVFLSGSQPGPNQNVDLLRGGELVLVPFDGDAQPDVVVTQRLGSGGPDQVLVFKGLASGLFDTSPQVLAVPAGLALAGGLAVVDLDGNGPEVLTSAVDGDGAGQLLLWRDAGGGAVEAHPLGADLQQTRSIVVGDVTGDGRADALLGQVDARLLLAVGTPTGGFEPGDPGAPAAAGGGGALALGDLDGDGRLDVVSCTSTISGVVDQAAVRTLVGRGDGTFAVQTEAGVAAAGVLGALRPLLADMNGDGATDLVLVHGAADAVSILLNTLNTFEAFGAGKPGKGGLEPRLVGKGYTTPGGAVQIVVENGVGAAPGLLFVGLDPIVEGFFHVGTPLLEFGLALSGAPGAAGAGAGVLPFVIPDDNQLVGAQVVLQAFLLDPAAGAPAPFNISATNGLLFVIVD